MIFPESWQWVWLLFRWSAAGLFLFLALVTAVAAWRYRGFFHWKKTLKQEMESLRARRTQAGPEAAAAMDVVLRRCQDFWNATDIRLEEFWGLGEYIRSIAACFYPGRENPERCISVGSIARVADNGVRHVQSILSRPGFERLRWVRIRHVRTAFDRYHRFREHPWIRILFRYRNWIRNMNRIRLVILPDPFSWLIFLSNQWILIRLTRFFLLDLYLFAGNQAIQAYAADRQAGEEQTTPEDPEQALEDLAGLDPDPLPLSDPFLRQIRGRLFGFSTLVRLPGVADWKKALTEALRHIAGRYFPESPNPVEEAALGPLVEQLQSYLHVVAGSQNLPVIRLLGRMPLSMAFRIREWGERPISRFAGLVVNRVWNAYQWLRVPLRTFRLLKKGTPAGMAMYGGWFLVQRGCAWYLGRQVFDLTCREIETVYARSRKPVVLPPESGYSETKAPESHELVP